MLFRFITYATTKLVMTQSVLCSRLRDNVFVSQRSQGELVIDEPVVVVSEGI